MWLSPSKTGKPSFAVIELLLGGGHSCASESSIECEIGEHAATFSHVTYPSRVMSPLRHEKWKEPDVDLRLSDEQRAVRETFAALFRKESTPQRVRIAESTGIDQALWRSYSAIEAL